MTREDVSFFTMNSSREHIKVAELLCKMFSITVERNKKGTFKNDEDGYYMQIYDSFGQNTDTFFR